MNQEQLQYIDFVNRSAPDELLIKTTGTEGITLADHSHPKHEIIHTLSGTLHIRTGSASYFVPEHHIAWIPRDATHELSSNNRQISLQIFYCDLDLAAKDSFAVYNTTPLITENLKFISQNDRHVIRKTDSPDLYNYAVSFLKLIPDMEKEYRVPLQALVVPDDARLRAVLEYINGHLHDNLCMSDIAARFGFSTRNLSRLFRKSDICFNSYLNYQRVTRAIELIADGDRTMQQIAYEVGFNTPSHFNRVFRQLLGTNPGSFAKKSLHKPK